MKEFDLDKALNGEPVVLRNGCKAIVYYKVPDEYKFPDNKPTLCPLKGLVFDINGKLASSAMYWYESGKFNNEKDHSLDIVGMWEEPINHEELPKPFIPQEGDSYYHISNGYVILEHVYLESNDLDRNLAKHGQCFRTEEDAQVWLDFMKSKLK